MLAPIVSAAVDNNTSNHATFAALVGLAILLAKILEITVSWLKKKYTDDKDHGVMNGVNGAIPMVQLDPETLKLFRGMQDDLEKSQKILEEHLEEEMVAVEHVREIAVCLKDVAHTQERLSKQFDERIDRLDMSMRSIKDDIYSLK